MPTIPDCSLTDTLLAKRVAAGDPTVFDEVYRRYTPALRVYAARLVGPSLADDAVHDALASTQAALHGRHRVVNLPAWLYRCVRNACISELRRREPLTELPEELGATAPDAYEQLRDRTHATKLMRGIARLPERQRQALVMRAIEGVPYEDVAAHFALNRNAAAQLVHRARRGLAVQLTRV